MSASKSRRRPSQEDFTVNMATKSNRSPSQEDFTGSLATPMTNRRPPKEDFIDGLEIRPCRLTSPEKRVGLLAIKSDLRPSITAKSPSEPLILEKPVRLLAPLLTAAMR